MMQSNWAHQVSQGTLDHSVSSILSLVYGSALRTVADMESLNDTPILKFNANTLHEIRKEYNLHHEGVMDQMITSFEDWIQKQNHFKKKDFGKIK